MSQHCVEIIPATLAHGYELARNLRAEDRAEVSAAGDPRHLIRHSIRRSFVKRTALVDGRVAAMWGMGGTVVSNEGDIWLLTTAAVELAPVRFIRQARAEIEHMLTVRSRLSGTVAVSYGRAVRLLEVLGFTIEPPTLTGRGGELFSRYWRER